MHTDSTSLVASPFASTNKILPEGPGLVSGEIFWETRGDVPLSLAPDLRMKTNELSDLLYNYFIQRKSLSLPGIGTFDMNRVSAQTDFANKKILPPVYAISYNHLEDAPHKDLFDYIARKKNIADWEAIRAVNDFSIELKSRINRGEAVEWEGIGLLKQGLGRDIQFDAERLSYAFIPHVGAQRVIRQGASHAVLVGDRERNREEMTDFLAAEAPEYRVNSGWWNLAAIIAAVAVMLIAIRAFSGGVSPYSGRQNQVRPAEPAVTHTILSTPDSVR
jgi:hypothetical protein